MTTTPARPALDAMAMTARKVKAKVCRKVKKHPVGIWDEATKTAKCATCGLPLPITKKKGKANG